MDAKGPQFGFSSNIIYPDSWQLWPFFLQRALLDPAAPLVNELEEVLALVVAVDRQEDGQEGGNLVRLLLVVVKVDCSAYRICTRVPCSKGRE